MINNNEVNIESNTNFYCIKDEEGNVYNDKCIVIINKKIKFWAYKTFCQATKGYIDSIKADVMRITLQHKVDMIGSKVKLHIEKLLVNEFTKDSQIVYIKI